MIALGVLLLLAAGCNRAHYRRQADREVYGLIGCGSTDPRWPLDDYTIEPDPRSRFFDPYSPDRPPMPPDDPTSHLLMHCVDGKRGWPYEQHYGATPHVENPAWERDLAAYLPSNEQGVLVLDRQAAVTAALIHSRSYQQELEDLYLSALDVSLQRFQFDTQFFGDNSTFFTVDGPLHGDGESSSTLANDTTLQAKKLCATGSQLTTEIANSVLWQFSGNDGHRVTTPISFAFFQPLLRHAGRAVVLDELTDSERALLADIRQMERFRHGFYIDTIAGPGRNRGYLQLLQQQLEIRNQRANVVALRDSLERLDAFLKTGQVDPMSADQTRQELYSSQIELLVQSTTYQERLDSYKIDVGLPPRLDVEIRDPLLDPFNLIDPALVDTRNDLSNVLEPVREGTAAVADALEAAEATSQAGRAAQATLVMLLAAEAAAEAIDAAGQGDFARAAQAASRAATLAEAAQTSAEAALRAAEAAAKTADVPEDVDLAPAESVLVAMEAAGAEDRAKAAKAAAEAAAEAVTAIEAAAKADPTSEAGEHERAIAATAKATTKAAEAAARAAVEVATRTARAAVKAAQATRTSEPAAAAELAAHTARAAGTSVDWAELGEYPKAAEAALQAAGQAAQTISAAIDRATSGDYTQAAEAAARANDAVEAARQAMVAAEPSQYAGAVEAAVAATLTAAEAALAATMPEDTAQAAAQAAARVALTAVEAALAAAKAEETARGAANAAKTATEPADYADELAQSARAAGDAAVAASKANRVAQAASQAAQLAADAAKTVVLQGEALAALAEATEALLPKPDQQQTSILDAARDHVALVRRDTERLHAAREDRCRQLEELAKRPEFQRGDVDPGVVDVGALNRRVVELYVNFQGKWDPDVRQLADELLRAPADRKWLDGLPNVNGLANDLPATLDELAQVQQDAPQLAQDAGDDLAAWHRLLASLRDPLSRLSEQLADLSLVQARARLDTTTFSPVELDSTEATEIARFNRRDWMNARAALVDQWRQVEVVANDLKSQLDLKVEGNITPRADTLKSVHNTMGHLTVGLEFDAPLTRREERNAYRRTLIEYQRARRQYYAFEDQVSQSLRQTLRSIHLTPLQFELQRAAVHTAITRTEHQTYRLRMGRLSGGNAGRDIVDAFKSLLTAQNSFLRTWLAYEILRVDLDFDLGTMQLDDRGIWIDPGTVGAAGPIPSGEYETLPLGPEVWPLPEFMPPAPDQEQIHLPEVRDLPTAHKVDQPAWNVAFWLKRP